MEQERAKLLGEKVIGPMTREVMGMVGLSKQGRPGERRLESILVVPGQILLTT